jgi:hypothetical protein
MEILDDVLVREIENCIFEAWDMGLAGNNAISYVCAMTHQPSFHVAPVMDSLINRMTND